MAAAASHDNGSATATTAAAAAGTEIAVVPQWKRELILRRRAIARSLPAGSSSSLSVQFTCPPVVAAVRHPIAAVDPSSRPPSQSPADVSGEQVAVLDSVADRPQQSDFGAMRLQAEPDRRSQQLGNGGVDPVKYRALMGEEKTRPRGAGRAAGVGLVLAGHNGGGGDGLSDSGEELAYGPGIVKKLKSKYMSMTLREGKPRGVRPSLAHMRRAASLENLVDSEQETGSPGLPPTGTPTALIKPPRFAKRQEASPAANKATARFRSSSRGNESIKRARSVEALLRYDAVAAETRPMIKSLSRDEIVIVDKPIVEDNKAVAAVTVARSNKKPVVDDSKAVAAANVARNNKKRPAMNGLPPADVVKTTLKLFESGVARGNLAKLNVNTAPSSGKPMLSPKPSPEKMRRANPLAVAMAKKSASPVDSVAMDAERRAQLLSPVTVEVHELPSRVLTLDLKSVSTATTSPSSPRQPPPISPFQRTLSPVAKLPSPVAKPMSPVAKPISPVTKSQTPVAKPISPVAKPMSPVTKSPSPVAKLPSPVSKPTSPVAKQPSAVARERTPSPVKRTVSPVKRSPSPLRAVTNGDGDEETTTDGCVVEKAVPATALENIRKAGHSVEISFKTSEGAKSHLPGSSPPSKAPAVSSAVNVKSPVVPKLAPSVPSPAVSKTPSVVTTPTVTKSPIVSSAPVGKSPVVPSATVGRSPIVPSSSVGKIAIVPSSSVSKIAIVPSSSVSKSATVSFPEKRVPMSPLPELNSPDSTKQVGVIRPIVSRPAEPKNKPPPTPALTEREMKKNLINSGKCEQPTKVVASLKASEIVSGNVSEALKDVKSLRDSVNANGTGLWDSGAGGKKPWHQHQNTVIFNFKDRKEVPDYIENDGIVMRIKREKIRPGDSGFVLLDPSLEESSTDCELDCADVMGGYAGPPSPCNVLFEGDNVLINGKSNLRKQPRHRKLRITFNDSAMQLFEYPSESSLLGDAAAGLPPPPAGPSPAPPAGGSSLASYTSKASMTTEDFQLGVTRTTPVPRPREADASATPAPASASADEDNVPWSATANDHLMF